MEAGNSARPSGARLGFFLTSLILAGTAQYCLAFKWQVGLAAPLWLAALVLFAASLWWAPAGQRTLPRPEADRGNRHVELALALVVIALGIFFKVHKLDEFPPGLNHDAAWEGQYALAILNGIPYTPFISAAWGRETLTFYFRAPFVWWLGNVPLAVYLPSVIAGCLFLPFLYWWVRTMFGVRVALLTTALHGVSGWSLVFSRTGWRSDFQPLFTILTCCFFWHGLETRKTWPFALAGIFLAATANTYNAGQAFPLVFLLWIPVFALQGWTLRGFLRRYGWQLLAGAVAFAAAIAPLAWYALTNWEKFFGRQTYLLQQYSRLSALKDTLLIFHYWANGDDFFVNTPGLEYFAAVLFPLGLVWCLVSLRDPRAQFLTVGFIVGLLPGLMSKPNMNRDIGTMPFVYGFAGLGAFYVAEELARITPQLWRRAVAASVAAALVVGSAWATYTQYLGPTRRLVWGYYPETTVLGQYLRTLMPTHRVWVTSSRFPTETLIYLTYQGGDPFTAAFTKYEDPSELLRVTLPKPGQRGLAFVFPDETLALLVMAELRNRYPEHEIVSLRYPPNDSGRIFARVLLVPASNSAKPAEPDTAPTAGASPSGFRVTAGQADLASLAEPRGVAVFHDGTIVVSDFGHDRVVWFDSALHPQFAIGGTPGVDPGQFRQPSGLAIGPKNELFVCDTWNHRIQVFSKAGEYLRQYVADLFSPRGVAVTRSGTLFIADSGNNRVVVLSPDGTIVDRWDGSNNGGTPLREPVGIVVDEETSTVYVTDNGMAAIRRFTLSGEDRGSFAIAGLGVRALSEPQIAWATGGNLWVNVPHAHEVRLYNPSGDLLRAISVKREGNTVEAMPMGVTEDRQRRRLLVTVAENELLALPLKNP
ncbi:MAG: hypothetical protein N3C12_06490 [Candidatus Binatia bacterium]|nr:hypothetical protein [Candidatus Binatia bacterium]